MRLKNVVALTASLFIAQVACAGAHVAKGTVGFGGWTFRTITSDSPTIDCPLVIVAFAPVAESFGENVIAVRYNPDAGSPTGWSSKAWASDSLPAIIKQLKEEFSLPDSEDDRWGLDTEVTGSVTAAEPAKDFDKGLFVDDPLYGVVSAIQSDLLVQALKDDGYPAAIVPFDKYDASTDCLVSHVLAAVTSAAREYESSGSTSLAMSAFANARDWGLIGDCFNWCGRVLNLDDWGWDVDCWYYVYGDWTTTGPMACGEIVRDVIIHPATSGTGGGVGETPSWVETCFSQTCFTPRVRDVTTHNRCGYDNPSTSQETGNLVTVKKCCMGGTVGWGPGNVPPCTLQ